jgi:hypothetical protein
MPLCGTLKCRGATAKYVLLRASAQGPHIQHMHATSMRCSTCATALHPTHQTQTRPAPSLFLP